MLGIIVGSIFYMLWNVLWKENYVYRFIFLSKTNVRFIPNHLRNSVTAIFIDYSASATERTHQLSSGSEFSANTAALVLTLRGSNVSSKHLRNTCRIRSSFRLRSAIASGDSGTLSGIFTASRDD